MKIDLEAVRDALGRQKFFQESAARTATPGVATGLAVTGAGGDVLFVEATAMKAGARRRATSLVLTGQLGDVMKESARIALSYVRGHAEELGIDESAFENREFHVHVPAGAIPKDGPSAGVTMVTALASLLSGRPVKHTVGMTGEVTLQGRVLPIGGLKQKVLAAHAAGLTDVILPERNRGDLDDIPEEVREADDLPPGDDRPGGPRPRTGAGPRCRARLVDVQPVPVEVRQTADLLERRWQLSIIYAALTGALRFNEFAEAVAGISPRMLVRAPARPRGGGAGRAHGDPLEPADGRVPAHRARAQARPDHRRDARLRRRTRGLSRQRAGEIGPGQLAAGSDELPAGAGRGVHGLLRVANPHHSHDAPDGDQRRGDRHAEMEAVQRGLFGGRVEHPCA